VIGIPTYKTPNVYTVTFKDGSIAEYTDDLFTADNSSISTEKSLLPHWIKGGTNATLFLHDMPKPCHGTLQCTSNNCWIFYPRKQNPRKQTDTNGILLKDLAANC
jgi:hypothetical protein